MKKKKPSDKKTRLIFLLFLNLWFVGLFLIFLPYFRDFVLVREMKTVQFPLSKTVPDTIPAPEVIRPPRIGDFVESSNEVTAVGQLQFSEVEIETPILVGVTNYNLGVGAVTMYPERDPAETNHVLLGHYLQTDGLLFGPLHEAEIGMEVSMTYLGKKYKYEVTEIKTVHQTEIEWLEEISEPLLTLITCTIPEGTDYRLIVRARLVESIEDPETNEETVLTQSSSYTERQLWWVQWRMVLLFAGIFLLGTFFLRWVLTKHD